MRPQTLPIKAWLLTETVRLDEERRGRCRDDQAAIALAGKSAADLAGRLAGRAAALPGSRSIRQRIARLFRRGWQGLALLGLLGAAGGGLGARSLVGRAEVDVLLAAMVLLGLPTLMLLAWLLVIVAGARRRASGSVLGPLALSIWARLGARAGVDDHGQALGQAAARLARSGFGRWFLSLASHLFWLGYGLAAVLVLVVFFSATQYDLSWGTTLLEPDRVVGLIQSLAAWPAWLGLFPAIPDAEWIARGQAGLMPGSDRDLWAQFLIALVLAYVVLPRAMLVLISAILAAWTAGRLPLDVGLPGYLRLRDVLMPEHGPVRRHGTRPEAAEARALRGVRKARGPAVLVGVERAWNPASWPPVLPGIEVLVLGQADQRAQRLAVSEALAALDHSPPALVVVCSLLRTPDAGIEATINALADRARTRLIVLLDERRALNDNGVDATARIDDWLELVRRCGGRGLVIDLQRPAGEALERLKGWIEGDRDDD